LRPRMVLRALRPPMILGASLPGMIFPAQRPAEGSNSYHYGSYATNLDGFEFDEGELRFHTTMVLTQPTSETMARYHSSRRFHTTMVLTQPEDNNNWIEHYVIRFHTTMVLTQPRPWIRQTLGLSRFPYHYGSHATRDMPMDLHLGHVSIPLWFSRNHIPLFL